MAQCSYCKSEKVQSQFLVCSTCDQKVHIECLKSGCVPGGLLGDTFFRFVCRSCSEDDSEQIFRQKMSWFAVISLTLYNLHRRSEGVSRRGFYHWKIHICNFIDRHWNILFDPTTKRKKSWMGTVSGTLSHFFPSFFKSGTEVLKEPGWWCLVHVNKTPEEIVNAHAESQMAKKKGSACRLSTGNSSQQTSLLLASQPSTSQYALKQSSELGGLSTNVEKPSTSHTSDVTDNSNIVKPSKGFLDNIIVEETELINDMAMDIDDDSIDFVRGCGGGFQDFESLLPPVSSYSAESSCSSILSILPDITSHTEDHLPQFSLEDKHLNTVFGDNEIKTEVAMEIKEEGPDPTSDEGDGATTEEDPFVQPEIPKSLFKITPEELRVPPWKALEKKDREDWIKATQKNLVPMSEYEELQLLSQLRQAAKHHELPDYARRLYRKLCVRQHKRQLGLPIFNLDNIFLPNGKTGDPKSVWEKSNTRDSSTEAHILDRFYHVPMKLDSTSQSQKCSFKIRLMGQNVPACFHSPYTQRLLKPFIRRDYETTPLWLKLLTAIQEKSNKNNPDWKPPPRSPIDYCYVRPHHISTVNSLCCEFFYPGIDLSEALQYPDFSCVVLYKKLIVAFAFMVPDAGFNETYISFLFTRPEWRNAGIATFMIYHLIQTCLGKDITLHVSATNPAVLLYQKFGFKIEEFIVDFYDKYLPADSNQCKHALFLRLSR